jgi:predicted branched-subunit amino acid permease
VPFVPSVSSFALTNTALPFTVVDVGSSDRTLREDARDALALAVAVSVVAVSFGALATAAGLPLLITMAMSLLVLAGGAQFLAVAIIAAGGGAVAAVAGGLLLNLRHLPYGLAVADVVGDRWPAKVFGAHLLIDEVVAFSRARGSGARARRAYWTSGILLATFWNAGTLLGVVAGSAIPDPSVFGVDAAFPAALLALLLPALRQSDARRVGLASAVIAVAATPFLAPGLPVLAGLLGLAVAGRK